MNYKELIKENVDCEVWIAKLMGSCWGFDKESNEFKLTEEFLAKHNFEILSSDRSSDGDHDGWDVYFKFDDKFFGVVGWYSSEGGVEFNEPFDIFEVKPVQKMVTVYEVV